MGPKKRPASNSVISDFFKKPKGNVMYSVKLEVYMSGRSISKALFY